MTTQIYDFLGCHASIDSGCVTMCLVGAWVDANEQLDLIDRTEWGGKQNHLPVVVTSGFYLRFLQIGFDKVV